MLLDSNDKRYRVAIGVVRRWHSNFAESFVMVRERRNWKNLWLESALTNHPIEHVLRKTL
jgi:hypothetical protein